MTIATLLDENRAALIFHIYYILIYYIFHIVAYLMRIGGHCAEEGHVDILEKKTL